MNMFDCAAKHEKEAIKLYTYLADEASLVSLKRLFSSLLKDEQKHLERITNYKATLNDDDSYRPDKNEFSRLFPQIIQDRGIEDLCKDEVRFYREVMDCEKNGINQYEYFLYNAPDEKSKKLLSLLISQEKLHYDIVKGLCVFISEQQGFR
ncbi:MAG: ferritin family protein [Syntrophaceae bacterium]|jgi:rubrerythrin|nr:ferritin family protein [Syntrophaceae bacterium]